MAKEAKETEYPDSMWDTVRGVVFVLGVAAALTWSFTVLTFYENTFASAGYSYNQVDVGQTYEAPVMEREKEHARHVLLTT